ncbi:MAG: hypothetical protein Q7U75_06490, partial [Desulfobacterales bacterium]|nr:hypothetical protein [Desulfobacterales bacterium]
PWRSVVGAASFVRPGDTVLIHAARPETLMAVGMPGALLTSHPMVATALAGLDDVVSEGQIVQAILISPLFGLDRGMSAELLLPGTGTLEEVRERIMAEADARLIGIPPYFGGIIADVQMEGPGVALSLTYAECEMAGQAAEMIAQRWVEMMPEPAQGEITHGAVAGPGALCAAVFTVEGASVDPVVNPVFGALFDGFIRGQFDVLRIGNPG